MNEKTIRIALIGPESSGKTNLCKALAAAYNTAWVPEFAREYLRPKNGVYTMDDVIMMLREQLSSEKATLKSANRILFCDTEPVNFKVWLEHVYGETPLFVDDLISENPYDLYLLTAADLEWENDPLRENPGKGAYFFEWYKKILEAYGLKYAVIAGSGDERTKAAIKAVTEATGIQPVS